MSYYSEIEYILRNEKINKISDIYKLDILNGRIGEVKYPWVRDLADLVEHNLVDENRKMVSSVEKEIVIDDLISYENNDILKYSIFFPDKTVLSAGTILLTDREITISEKFLYNFINGKKLIENHLVNFCATASYYECRGGLEGLWLDKYCREKFIKVNATNKVYDSDNDIFIQLPWLYNIDMDNYINIINENRLEFQNYSLYLTKLWRCANGEEIVTKEILYEIKEFIMHMNIMLEKGKSKIKVKTGNIMLGLCFTIIPYVIGNVCNKELISAFLGGSTIKELIDIPSEIKEMNEYNRGHSLWVIWKLFKSQID